MNLIGELGFLSMSRFIKIFFAFDRHPMYQIYNKKYEILPTISLTSKNMKYCQIYKPFVKTIKSRKSHQIYTKNFLKTKISKNNFIHTIMEMFILKSSQNFS